MRTTVATMCLLLLLLVPRPGTAQECDGLSVASVVIDGCGIGRCGDPKTQAALVSLAALEGKPWSDDEARTAGGRLRRTGYFFEVLPSCKPISAVEAQVLFSVIPNRYVRKVAFTGTRSVFTEDLQKRVFFNQGAILNPDSKDGRERLDRQTSNLVAYMKQEGFEKASVTAETMLVEPDLVDILFRVREGRVARVEKVSASIEGPWDPSIPEQFACPSVSRRDIENVVDIGRGSLFTQKTSRETKRQVRYFLQQYGFQSPRIKVEYLPDTQELSVHVRLSQCFSIQILEREEPQPYGQGFERYEEPELFSALPFRESGVFDLREAQLGVEELLAWYRVRGFLFATVELQVVDYREMSPGWPYPLVGGVTYRVTRGQPSEIREIKLVGVRAFPKEDLLSLMRTRRYDFFDTGGYLEVEQLFGDLDVIRNHYETYGYFKMSWRDAHGTEDQVRIQISRKDDTTIYRYRYLDKAFDVVKPDWENAVTIRLAIDEGPSSRIRSLQFVGAAAFPPQQILKDLPAQPGGPFSPQIVRQAVQEITRRYEAAGRSVTVGVMCVGSDPDLDGGACDVDSVHSRRVDLSIRLSEGPRRMVGELFVVGNLKTTRGTILRDFPRTGEPYEQDRIDDAVRRLRSLGVFSSVRLVTIGLDESPPRESVALSIQVEEAATRFVEVSAGFQKMIERGAAGSESATMAPEVGGVLSNSLHYTGSPLTGGASFQLLRFPDVLLLAELSYNDKNFLGLARNLYVPLSYGFSTRDPARYAAFQPTYLDRRLLGSDITWRLTPLVIYDRALSYVDKFEYGMENEFSYPFFEHIYLSLLSRLTRVSQKRFAETAFGSPELQVSVAPQLRLDWRDNPINPTSGFYGMGKVTYLNAYEDRPRNEEAALARVNFLKYEFQTQGYLSFRRTFILGLNLRYGHSWSAEGGHLPPNQKFYLGTTSGMRGFPVRGVPQYNRKGEPLRDKVEKVDPDTGGVSNEYALREGGDTMVNGSLELRFPLLRLSGLWGAAFLDSGAVSQDLGSLHAQSVRFSAGLGVRWLIGDQIPIRLDYGFVLDPRCNRYDGNNQCISEDDTGALDFGLLYTF
jgi:outer membrane protein assembly factor BamA